MYLHNIRAKKEQRRELRYAFDSGRGYLWSFLQRRQLGGRKFRRQHSVRPYISDFYCPEEQLAVELGRLHARSRRRTEFTMQAHAFLEGLGSERCDLRTGSPQNMEACCG